MRLFFPLLALACLAACASPDSPQPAPSEAPSVSSDSAAVAPDAADPESWTAGIVDVPQETAAPGRLVEVRTAAHEGYDRIVFAFDGAGVPGYHLEYVDAPVYACGSGEAVPVAGEGWLEIRFAPTAAHTEAGESTLDAREHTPGLSVLRELKLTCDFEADVTWVAGVVTPNPFRAFTLRDPARLVVDVQH